MWQAYTGEHPFAEVPNGRDVTVTLKVIQHERPKRPTADQGKTISDDMWALIEVCWNQEPSDRPDIGDVLKRMGEMGKVMVD
jgi:hypothetical protein